MEVLAYGPSISFSYPDNLKVGTATCPVCGCLQHQGGVGACPSVKEIEFYPNGQIKKVVKRW